MIGGLIHNPNASVEDRAVDREVALKHAEYFAKNYFNDSNEAQAFLIGIQKFADNDIMREKGYTIIEGSGLEPFKNYAMPEAPDSYINGGAFLKKYDSSLSAKDLVSDSDKMSAFLKSILKNGAEWKKEIISDFESKEKLVSSSLNA